MADYKQPISRKALRSFLGSIGCYRRFIFMFARLSSVLTPATSTKAPGTIQWMPEMLDAFSKLRESLCDYCVLTVPRVMDCFEFHTDASGQGIGSVLKVIRKNEVLPVVFYSRQVRGSERRYSATELEALAVCESIKYFDHFLYGATFKVLTDHKPLTSLLTSKSLNRKIHGMALNLMVYDVSIVYRNGIANENADGLSLQAWERELKEEEAVDDPVYLDSSVSGLVKGDCGAAHSKEKKRERERKSEHLNHMVVTH